MAVSESPAITVKEIDLTGVVPNVGSTTGAFVGNFNWGPADAPILVSDEAGLVSTFGSPEKTNSIDFHSAAYYLRYTSSLYVVRELTEAAGQSENGYDARATGAPRVKNEESFESQKAALDSANHTFVAKYPGTLGNSLQIQWLAAVDSADDPVFTGWAYEDNFDGAPLTSDYVANRGGEFDETHVVVIDQDGSFTGTKGTVLETFPFVSVAADAKANDGTSNYIVDVINSKSEYVWMAGFGDLADSDWNENVGTNVFDLQDYQRNIQEVKSLSLSAGTNSNALTTTEYATGFDLFEDKDQVQVDFLIAPGMSTRTDHVTVVNDLVAIAAGKRKDCVVVASPARSDVVNVASPNSEIVETAKGLTFSSYLFVDNNYLKVYDKYNDQYIQIPAASSTAGIMAASDNDTAAWYSPAGQRRGAYLGVTGLVSSPNKTERDLLYRNGVNPIANIPGQGILLYGDKTHLARPSAFDRINVRRLFLVVERAIAIAARNVLFEFNDEFTRAEFTNVIEPFLREIQGRRGITDFRVVANETNNTPAVIDRNEFVCSIFIKPARSINFVTLNFVAVRTGVDFDEVVGTV
jgi:phage tail sheath protein FI